MAQQSNIVEDKMRTIESASSLSVMVKESFFEWLSDGNAKRYPPNAYLACIDKVSVYLIHRKISILDLWEITNFGLFKSVYDKAINDNLFKATDKKTHTVFIQVGKEFLKFLKSKPAIHKAPVVDIEPPSQPDSRLTIKEAITRVLETEPHGMTGEQIYNKIITNGLYSFGTKKPLEVVRGEIDRACVNSNYTIRASKECFRFERNEKGEKVYFLLSKNPADDRAGQSITVEGKLTVISRTENIDIWSNSIDASCQEWLGQENYAKTEQTYSRPADFALAVPPKPTLDPAIIEQLTDVLSAHFANGYRLSSPIELVRFRSFATEELDEEITLTDEELKSYIAACGTNFDGKVYAVSAQAKERIKDFADEYFADGAQAIFFSEFYTKNENWLFGANVVSEDMLIGIFRRLFPKLSFTQTYFGYTDASVFAALASEILRVWGDNVLLTYEQLAERLRYIPLERIKYALSQNGDFIWNSIETFSHVCRIDISEDEREAIRNAAVQECNARGYASITDLPLGEIEERNYELSITAVHNAVFRICLSDKFDKSGKIVTRKGDTLDALTLMKDYCRTIDKCSLNDLLNYEKELTGEIHRWIPMEAGNTVLVRIDKDIYVADRYVHFDADTVDAAIELFIEHDYLPLKSFTTFGVFPDCGQTWNLFLLESYCRRFSKKFRFDAPSVNSRNAGVVIRKSCGLNYTEIMTDAVANADVSLSDSAVGRFLFDLGYTGRSKTAKVREIIDRAKAIRERRD